jgi:hypothetical protein
MCCTEGGHRLVLMTISVCKGFLLYYSFINSQHYIQQISFSCLCTLQKWLLLHNLFRDIKESSIDIAEA